uniref:Uncharacterized protein n=1 Tax=Anguilla anguilla TaxID=7936 RepID=A0A0E9WEP1_ANGAN
MLHDVNVLMEGCYSILSDNKAVNVRLLNSH